MSIGPMHYLFETMGIFRLGTHEVQNFGVFLGIALGYYPWVPVRIGYPKFGHPRVIPELYYDKKCSYIQKYKYY